MVDGGTERSDSGKPFAFADSQISSTIYCRINQSLGVNCAGNRVPVFASCMVGGSRRV